MKANTILGTVRLVFCFVLVWFAFAWFALLWVGLGGFYTTHLTVYGSVLVSMIRCFMILVSSLARSTFHSHVNLFF